MLQPKVNTQPAQKRARNFNEVSLGYSKKQALEEARRCPQCANPTCMEGCPLGIDIPGFIRNIRENEPAKALARIKEHNMLASICGRLCPAPCERACVFADEGSPIGIRALERYAADYGQNRSGLNLSRNSKKVAVVGSGPSGLTAAGVLAYSGYQVTVFEALSSLGGVLKYGIPEYRLPKRVLDQEIAYLTSLGIEFKTDCLVGQTELLDDFFNQGFSSVLLALGAGTPKNLEIPGTNLGGVCYAEEFLMRVNLFKADQNFRPGNSLKIGYRVAVIGAGHAALDAARTALRFGRNVTLILRRTEDDMSVRLEEKDYAKEEGIKIEALTQPLEVLGDENYFVRGLKCRRMDFADPTNSGQWQLLQVPDSEFILDVDSVIIAVGHAPNSQFIRRTPNLKTNSNGSLWTDEGGMTSRPGVFACGGISQGPGSVVQAIASGKHIAFEIDRFLGSNTMSLKT